MGGWAALNAFTAAATASHHLKIPSSFDDSQIKLGSPFTGGGSLKIEGGGEAAMDPTAQKISRVSPQEGKDAPPAGAPSLMSHVGP